MFAFKIPVFDYFITLAEHIYNSEFHITEPGKIILIKCTFFIYYFIKLTGYCISTFPNQIIRFIVTKQNLKSLLNRQFC